MHFSRIAAAVISLGAGPFSVLAQSSTRIAFTTLPGSVTAGQPVTLKWTGGDSSPVTITLKQGDPGNLKTVQLVTGDATGDSYTWTPSSSLPNAANYALQITQDDIDINYTGLFSLSGGSSSSSSSSSLMSASASASPSTPPAVGIIPASTNNNASNATTTGTGMMMGGTGTGVGTGTATGPSMPRNTTMSMATLSSTITTTASSTTGEGLMTSTSSTSSTPKPTSSSAANERVGSNVGLVFAAIAGVVMLG